MKKVTLTIYDMHCTSCALLIDGELEDTEGVSCSHTSYAQQHTDIEFDEQKITEKQLVQIVKKVGYRAQIKE